MPIAQIGPLTGLMESVAAAVAAGMLLGGFVAGIVGLIRGRPRKELDRTVLGVGYLGGVGGAFAMVVDITFRHVA